MINFFCNNNIYKFIGNRYLQKNHNKFISMYNYPLPTLYEIPFNNEAFNELKKLIHS